MTDIDTSLGVLAAGVGQGGRDGRGELDLPSQSPRSGGHRQEPTRLAGLGGLVEGAGEEFRYFDSVEVLRARVATRIAADRSGFARLDLDARRMKTQALVIEELDSLVQHRAATGQAPLSIQDEDHLVAAATDALSGLGPLERLLARDDVEDIFFAGSAPTVLRLADGSKVAGPALAATDAAVVDLLTAMASSLGDGASREFSSARPLMSLRLKSIGELGARLSAAMDVTPRPSGTIRVHRHVETDLDALHRLGMIDSPLRAFLMASVAAGAKILVSGATGVGKTTLLRALCAQIPIEAMIVTVEDDRELGLHVIPQRDQYGAVVRDPATGRARTRRPEALVRPYEARPNNSEGSGGLSMGDCLFQALRDSPDVLVVGETRGGEVVHILDAATNGIAGVMSTIHAESPAGVFERIVMMVRKASPPLPPDYALRAATALDLIVQVRKDDTHHRFVSEVVQVQSGPLGENGYPVTHSLFTARPGDGRAVATYRPTPDFLQRLTAVGFDPAWLDPSRSDWALPDDSTDPTTPPTGVEADLDVDPDGDSQVNDAAGWGWR